MNYKHGLSNTKLYSTWVNMLKRCTDEKKHNYYLYGGAGIEVCRDWLDFKNFYDWSINNGYCEGLSIDRIDGSKNYQPENCRWIEFKEQSKNRKSNLIYEIEGQSKTLTEWCKIYNVNFSTTRARLKKGMSIKQALNAPSLKGKIKIKGEKL